MGKRCKLEEAAHRTWRSVTCSLNGLFRSLFVLDDDGGILIWGGNRQTLLFEKRQMFFHPPSSLIQAIFDGMADTGEPLKIGRKEPEEVGIVRRFNHERIFEVDHAIPPDA